MNLQENLFYHKWEFTHELVDWNPGGFFKKRQIISSDILVRSVFEQDKIYRVSRLSLSWNSKDNIVDIIVLDPKYPVIIEYVDYLETVLTYLVIYLPVYLKHGMKVGK